MNYLQKNPLATLTPRDERKTRHKRQQWQWQFSRAPFTQQIYNQYNHGRTSGLTALTGRHHHLPPTLLPAHPSPIKPRPYGPTIGIRLWKRLLSPLTRKNIAFRLCDAIPVPRHSLFRSHSTKGAARRLEATNPTQTVSFVRPGHRLRVVWW